MPPSFFPMTPLTRRVALSLVSATVAACVWASWQSVGQTPPLCTWENVIIV